MSLAIALDQIQRPTWWVFEKDTRRYERSPYLIARRAHMLEFVLASITPVTTDAIMAETKTTRSQVMTAMKEFVSAGKVKQIKPRHDFSLWAKNA